MADYKHLIPKILKWEGGYCNVQDDRGGCTNKGVTIGTFRRFYGRGKTCEDLKRLTDEQWNHIFKEGYWDKCLADDIENQSIADLIVDWYWTSGSYAIKYSQGVLDVPIDGVMGPQTLSAINGAQDPKKLFQRLWERRKKHFEALARKKGQAKFLKGWLNRLNDFKYE